MDIIILGFENSLNSGKNFPIPKANKEMRLPFLTTYIELAETFPRIINYLDNDLLGLSTNDLDWMIMIPIHLLPIGPLIRVIAIWGLKELRNSLGKFFSIST